MEKKLNYFLLHSLIDKKYIDGVFTQKLRNSTQAPLTIQKNRLEEFSDDYVDYLFTDSQPDDGRRNTCQTY